MACRWLNRDRLASASLVAVVVVAVAVSWAPLASGAPTGGSVTGPISGGMGKIGLVTTGFDLSAVGYVGQEFFLGGTATAYSSARPLTADGRWKVRPASTAPYRTRLVVYRPSNPKRFNGIVYVEWLNVSAGFATPPDWLSGHVSLINDGAAWVGVDAQSVGVQGGTPAVGGLAAGGIKAADPVRYGSLSHPGDSYSYDIFTQAGVAARHRAPLLGGLRPQHVLAVGESQSAFRLVTYIDGIQPRSHAFDGFLVHSRWSNGAALSQMPLPSIPTPTGTVIRGDVGVPVLTYETETDLLHGYVAARQPESRRFRDWEVAGTAHADAYTGSFGFSDTGDGFGERKLLDVAVGGGPLNCSQPINNGPAYLVLGTALHALGRWVATGAAPPVAPRLAVSAGAAPSIVRDGRGNAVGGIRTPLLDAPIAAYSGASNSGGSFCVLFGTTQPFDAATLTTLYPTHADYVTKFDQATRAAVNAGFLLPGSARRLEAAAAASATN